jgi:small GTP-binding protein
MAYKKSGESAWKATCSEGVSGVEFWEAKFYISGMGSVFSRCFCRKKRCVALVGPSGAGKSSLLRTMKGDKKESEEIFEEATVRHRGYTLNVVDVEGRANLAHFWKFYAWDVNLVLFVVDISTDSSIVAARVPFEKFIGSSTSIAKKVVFLLNKTDLLGDPEKIGESIALFKKVFGDMGNFALSEDKILPCSALTSRKDILKTIRKHL